MDFKRKELAKNAKKNLKKHYWLLVAVCLFAAFIGSEFTETMEAFKSLGTVNNEIQGAASVEANVDTVANSSVVSSVVQAMGAVITGDDDSESTNVNTIPPDVIPLTKDANTPLVLPNTLFALSLASETFASDCVLPKSSSPVITAPHLF